MPPFLKQTATYLVENFGENLAEVAVVLPNRRAGLFLRKYLGGMLMRTTWSPSVLSIEEFITSVSGLREVDQVHCLFALYQVYQQAEKEKSQPFDEFLNWGGQVLSDFNEIDRYLVEPKTLFLYLDEVRAITVWNPDNTPLTEFQKSYLKFYNSLYSYYSGLTKVLLARGEAYQGLIFRHAWQRMESGEAVIPWTKVILAGFNALTTSEEKIIDHLVKQDKAVLLWDADSYYMDDPKQEAGDYLRQWFRKWPEWSSLWKSAGFMSAPKKIEVIGVPDLVGQVKFAGNLLGEWNQQNSLNERTAVVLPDEKLLVPLLNSLPESIEAVNITMGLPLSQTPMSDLLILVYEMHHHAIRMVPGKKKSGRFYFRDVVKVLQHPYITRLASVNTDGNQFAYHDLVERIKTGSRTFLQWKDMVLDDPGLFSASLEFLEPVFGTWDSLDGALSGLQALVDSMVFSMQDIVVVDEEKAEVRPPLIELEYAYAAARILRQLRLLAGKSADFLTWDSLAKFLKQLFDSTMLPFYGEPLKGLQIMGMLETRTLDFDRVIILSCNEGILPSGKNILSFIPFDVRRDFNLPLYRQKDAVYSYHFYRLLQHSSDVWLLYNTEPGPMGGGDPSRFIRQIETELPLYNPSITIRSEMLVTAVHTGKQPRIIEIDKDSLVLEKLRRKAVSGFAPTSLNAFRSCSLKFYFSDVAELKEPEQDEGDIDHRTLGLAVHHALMRLYTPLRSKILTKAVLATMVDRIEGEIESAFQEVFKGDGIKTGKNLLLVEVAKIMVRKFIQGETRLVEQLTNKSQTLTIELLEQPLSGSLVIPADGSDLEVRLKGFVDRVDRIGDITRVIDYKTGNVNTSEIAIRDWEELSSNAELDKGFQLLTYTWLLGKKSYATHYQAGIISLRKQAPGLMMVQVPEESPNAKSTTIGEREMVKIEEILTRILMDIFDPDQPFTQTPDEERCTYCPYRPICGR